MTDMHPEDIKAAIRKSGVSITALAESHGISKQTLSLAIGARMSARAERIIADCIGLDPATIWPSRYGRDGQRITLRRMAV